MMFWSFSLDRYAEDNRLSAELRDLLRGSEIYCGYQAYKLPHIYDWDDFRESILRNIPAGEVREFLYGNVYFISDKYSPKSSAYITMFQDGEDSFAEIGIVSFEDDAHDRLSLLADNLELTEKGYSSRATTLAQIASAIISGNEINSMLDQYPRDNSLEDSLVFNQYLREDLREYRRPTPSSQTAMRRYSLIYLMDFASVQQYF